MVIFNRNVEYIRFFLDTCIGWLGAGNCPHNDVSIFLIFSLNSYTTELQNQLIDAQLVEDLAFQQQNINIFENIFLHKTTLEKIIFDFFRSSKEQVEGKEEDCKEFLF